MCGTAAVGGSRSVEPVMMARPGGINVELGNKGSIRVEPLGAATANPMLAPSLHPPQLALSSEAYDMLMLAVEAGQVVVAVAPTATAASTVAVATGNL